MEQSQTGTQQQSSNQGYNHGTALKIRLDTKALLDACEVFLSGKKLIAAKKENGEIMTEYLTIGEPRLNAVGVQSLMNKLSLIFDPAVVQGNYDQKRWVHEICTIRLSMAKELMTNLYNWEIKESEYAGIIDSIMVAVKAYLSRLIENKERESYDNTIKHLESQILREKGRLGF